MAETIEDGLHWAARQLNNAWSNSSLINPRDEAKVYGIIATAKASTMGGWATIRVLEETRKQTQLLQQQMQTLQQQVQLMQQQNMILQQRLATVQPAQPIQQTPVQQQ